MGITLMNSKKHHTAGLSKFSLNADKNGIKEIVITRVTKLTYLASASLTSTDLNKL